MQFKVPQFLDIEDKIFGPFTFRQFVYLAGGAGISFILFRLLGFFLGAIPIAAVAGLSLALAFYKPNNKPFINMLEAGLRYATQSKLYIWQRRKNQSRGKREDPLANVPGANLNNGEPRLTQSKLRDLAWSLDVLDLSKEGKNFGQEK
jgi:hypothetical protein